MVSVKPTVHVTIRLQRDVKKEMDDLAEIMGVQKTYLCRWIIEGFMETIKDAEEPPDMPAVTQIARRLIHKKKQKYKVERDD